MRELLPPLSNNAQTGDDVKHSMTRAEKILSSIDDVLGASRAELVERVAASDSIIDAKVRVMLRAGWLYSAQVQGHHIRYFKTSQAALDWAAQTKAVPTAEQQIKAIYEANPHSGYSGRMMAALVVYANKNTVNKALHKMHAAGELVIGRGHGYGTRYFRNESDARKYDSESRELRANVNRASAATRTEKASRCVVAKSVKAPGYVAAKDTRPAIIPEGLEIKRYGASSVGDKRYQVQPGEEVPRVFRSIPYGATLQQVAA